MSTLSDEEVFVDGPIGRNGPIYNREHVRQFIKNLKKEMKLCEVYKKDKKFNDLMDSIIDKLAGEKLIDAVEKEGEQ